MTIDPTWLAQMLEAADLYEESTAKIRGNHHNAEALMAVSQQARAMIQLRDKTNISHTIALVRAAKELEELKATLEQQVPGWGSF